MNKIAWRENGVTALQLATDEDPYVGLDDLHALNLAATEIAADMETRAVLLLGGSRNFCLGANRQTLTSSDAPRDIAELMRGLPRLVLDLPVPVIAAMEGHALGGGFIVGLWCDSALLARESLYGANFVAIGMTPGMGSTVVLDEAVGAPLGRSLLYSGRLVKGDEIRDAHVPLSHAVVPRKDVVTLAKQLAEEMAQVPREVSSALKKTLASRRRQRIEAALDEEQAMHDRLFSDPETRRLITEKYLGAMEKP
jgi:enoyl-CoA hydratase/carnithine racemase